MRSFYGEDLAHIHIEGYSSFVEKASPNIVKILKRKGITSGLIVDLGCGGGHLSEALAASGFHVLGIDVSQAMIRRARKRVRKGTFVCGSILSKPLSYCDAVVSAGEVMNYLDSKRSIIKVFRKVYDALRQGGVFVFDIYEPEPSGQKQSRTHFQVAKDWAIFVTVEENPGRNLLVRRITSFRKIGKGYRRSEEIHLLRIYKASEVEKWLQKIGFRTRKYHGYGKFRFKRRNVAFIAAKT